MDMIGEKSKVECDVALNYWFAVCMDILMLLLLDMDNFFIVIYITCVDTKVQGQEK